MSLKLSYARRHTTLVNIVALCPHWLKWTLADNIVANGVLLSWSLELQGENAMPSFLFAIWLKVDESVWQGKA